MSPRSVFARLIAVAAGLLLLVPMSSWVPAAATRVQDPTAIRCAGVELASQLNRDPDLNPDGSPVRITADRRGKFVPVVIVHGWTGRSTHTDPRTGAFSHKIDLSTNQVATVAAVRSLVGQLQRNPGTAVFTFDYHDYSARWVDDPHIGPALGDAIDCLFAATGEKVIIVAHSMGGLAARYALSHRGSSGVDRATEVSTVVTFGTPNAGSLMALLGDTALKVGASTNSALAVIRLILAACGRATSGHQQTGTLCDMLPALVRTYDSDAFRALRHGSAQLAALAPFPKSITVDALAGDTIFTVPKAGWFHLPWEVDTVPIGDIAVTTESAVQGSSLSATASCSYQVSVARGLIDAAGLTLRLTARNDVAQPITKVVGACYHGNLMRTIQLTNEATGVINEDIEARSPGTKVITVVPVDKDGNPASGFVVADDGTEVDCGSPTSYPSPASIGHDIVTCSPTAAAADVCWVEPSRVTVLCGWDPWDATLHRSRTADPVSTPVPPDGDPLPWALELEDGTQCRLRNGGSWSGRSDDLVGAYYCDQIDDVVLVKQEAGFTAVDRSSPVWTVQLGVLDEKLTGSPPPRTVGVRTAYFAGSP